MSRRCSCEYWRAAFAEVLRDHDRACDRAAELEEENARLKARLDLLNGAAMTRWTRAELEETDEN